MKNIKFLSLLLILTVGLSVQCKNQEKKYKGTLLKIETTLGNMTVQLYDETPKHKINFLKLIKEHYYDGMLFHRVIKDFMIQTGDPDSKTATKDQNLGSGGPGYTIDAEFNPALFHKKGALSAARKGDVVNPEKKSSGSQFYIVQGKIYSDRDLDKIEVQRNDEKLIPLIRDYIQDAKNETIRKEISALRIAKNQKGLDSLVNVISGIVQKEHLEIKLFKFSAAQRSAYKKVGGTPFLDDSYTVFGQVVEGMKVIDKIAAVETDNNDRPVKDVKIITIKLIK